MDIKSLAAIELTELVVVWQFVYRTCLLERDHTFPVSLKILKVFIEIEKGNQLNVKCYNWCYMSSTKSKYTLI